MLNKLRKWLRKSSRVHIRERGVQSLGDVVALIDRFLDGKTDHPLQWDDFVSWSHENPTIEAIRQRIADTEPLFFSGGPSDRSKALAILVDERNRAAALTGMQARQVVGMNTCR